jgi:hypothetical protein
VLAVDLQHDRHSAAAEKRVIHIQFVEPPEQEQILCTLRQGLVVVRGPWQPEQFALLPDAQVCVLWIDP